MKSILSYAVAVVASILLLTTIDAYSQNPVGGRIISGIVTDENNDPLPGAGVMTPDGKKGTITDIDGEYSITLSESFLMASLIILQEAIWSVMRMFSSHGVTPKSLWLMQSARWR